MPKIPLFQATPQSAGPSNVRANPGMYDAQNAAASRVGQAVAGLGEVMGAAAVQMQKAQNYKHTTTVQTEMEDEWNQFQQGINPATDETKWQEQWQKKLSDRVAKAIPKEAGPVLKAQLDAMVGQFKVRTSGDIGMQAKALGVQKARTAGEFRNTQLWENGDAEGAQANLDQMASLGLIMPEEVPSLMKKGQVGAERNAALRLINTDPIGAMGILEDRTEGGKPRNFANLDESDRYSLTTQAERNASQLRAGTYQQLTERMNNGELLTKDELDGLVDKKLMTATMAQSIMRQQKAGKLDVGAFADLSSRVLAYDRGADTSRKEFAQLTGEILAMPSEARSLLMSDLNKKDDPNHVLNSAIAKDAFQAIDQRFSLGIYGNYENRYYITKPRFAGDTMVGQWTTTVDAKAYEKATVKKRRIEDATRRYLEDNPKATAEQVNKFVSDMQQGETAKARRSAIMGSLGLPVTPSHSDDAKARSAKLAATLNHK